MANWVFYFGSQEATPLQCTLDVVVQSPSHVQLFATPWSTAHQASLSLTISQSLPEFMSIARVMPTSLDKKYQRECCISSGSDSTFMHLYFKKCASSSKLTVLSKVLQLQLGICLSGLALCTGWWFLFLVFFQRRGCLFLPGGPSGVFFCGVWWWRREFFWVLFWILVNRKAGNLPACYSVILKHDASDLEHRRCWKNFLRRSWNIHACLQGRTCFFQKSPSK